ncbi:MAG: hypothetical protein ACM3QZ_07195 [Solirubrobacterales bacterium]
MKRWARSGLVGVIFLVCFGFGLTLAHYQQIQQRPHREAVAETGSVTRPVKKDTPVVLEQAFTKCGHIVTNGYGHRGDLVGKNAQALTEMFPYRQGYLTWVSQDGTFVIHQRIADWCPVDKNKVHLGVYKDHVAVFKGPASVNDEVVRVTAILISALPLDLRADVSKGRMEFPSEEEANYVLENLDEYE